MSNKIERTFASESEVNRYNAGYDAGLAAPPGSWHPYAMFDLIWGMGFRDALAEFSPPKS
jgi:hypothetical protein